MKCSFCGTEIPKGTGKMYSTVNGTLSYFCSNNCEKQTFKMKRKSENVKWTESYHKSKAVRLNAKGKEKEAKK